jgi:hypothetical protein
LRIKAKKRKREKEIERLRGTLRRSFSFACLKDPAPFCSSKGDIDLEGGPEEATDILSGKSQDISLLLVWIMVLR